VRFHDQFSLVSVFKLSTVALLIFSSSLALLLITLPLSLQAIDRLKLTYYLVLEAFSLKLLFHLVLLEVFFLFPRVR
jgi:hypothetical protein